MAANNNDDFPQIKLDEEDRRGHQQKTPPARGKTTASAAPAGSSNSSGGNGLATFALILALGAGGAAGYLYMQLQTQLGAAQNAEARIADLENRLSATGEDLGESTVALQVKVSELSNRADELWEQMDKLWASAWRRNQKELGDLTTKVDEQVAALRSTTSTNASTGTTNKQTLDNLLVQVDSLASEVLSLNVQLERASVSAGSTQRDLQAATERLTLLEQRNAALVTRLNQVETEVRNLATKIASTGP
ncbi:hypothetical protein QTP81_08030 [Alteromonas sp. ASW11-36]|uniref:Uncharacterized protein n=1 Tax=Alteromonas arenosi TaxID=3055817 RepID=A0ABT7SWH6_9ALTE|nr:hypothetical protein [Alteromonas sp. ASW11-36]MDM7860541.1 hypothetical protein [Alteromonas sp. ASW11-36]